jgi:hypothetical protein
MTGLLHAFPAQIDSVDGPVKASVILTWSPDTPMVLDFDMASADALGNFSSRQKWSISRDLVLDALATPGEHGEGDVITEARAPFFLLFLHGEGEGGEWLGCQLRMPLGAVAWLAEQSAQIIAPGSEAELATFGSWADAQLARLLDGAA